MDYGFLFVSLENEDLKLLRRMKKKARRFFNSTEEMDRAQRKTMLYSRNNEKRSLPRAGYAENKYIRGYLVRTYATVCEPCIHSGSRVE